MNITDENRKLLVDEFRNVVEEMKKTDDENKKLYFFTATHSMINRIFNMEFDPLLLFIHQILSLTYSNIQQRLFTIDKVGDKTIEIPPELYDGIRDAVEELASAINEKDENKIYKILQKFVTIGYVTNGNGYYLYRRGKLKI